MLTHEKYINKANQYQGVRLNFNSRLLQEYQVLLSESQPIKIVVADVSEWISTAIQGGEMDLHSTNLVVHKIDDVWRWVYRLGVMKKMGQVGAGQKFKSQVLGHFDALYWNCNQEWFGVYAVERLPKFAQITVNMQQRLLLRLFRFVLAQYHTFNIILGQIQPDSCLWDVERKRPLLRLPEKWYNVDYEQGHKYWLQLKEDPFAKDYNRLQEAIKTALDASQELPKKKANQSLPLVNSELFKKAGEILLVAYTKTFDEFKQKYKQLFQKPFSIHDNQTLFTNLRELYTHKGNHLSLTQLLQLGQEQYRAQMARSPKIQQMNEVLLELKFLKFKGDLAGNSSISSIFQEMKKVMSLEDPFFVERIVFGIGKKEGLDKIAKSIPTKTKEGRVRWHFLQAKIQWKSGNLYRSLAHLRQARKETQESKILHIIAFQQARNWQQLGFVDKAEHFYIQSKIFAELSYGSSYYLLLPNFYNLKLLYFKQGNFEKAEKMQHNIKKIKEAYPLSKIRKNPQLLFSRVVEHYIQTYVSLDEKEKAQKVLTKTEVLKLQVERLPYLDPLLKGFKSILQQPKPERSLKTSQIDLSSFLMAGETKTTVYLLKLLGQLLGHSEYKLTQTEVADILEQIKLIKGSNLKKYHRLLFLLSCYLEPNDAQLSAQCVQNILKNKNMYSKVVRFSLVKRLALLYKKQNKIQQILKLYNNEDLLSSGDVQSIFYWISLCSGKGLYTDIIRLGKWYLAEAKNYEATEIKGTFYDCQQLDCQLYVKMEMVKSYAELRCFAQVQNMLEDLEVEFSEKKVQKMKLVLFLGNICVQVYEMNQNSLCYNLIQKCVRNWMQFQQQKPENALKNEQNLLKRLYTILSSLKSKESDQSQLFFIEENWLKDKVGRFTDTTSVGAAVSSLSIEQAVLLKNSQVGGAKFDETVVEMFSELSEQLKQKSPSFQTLFTSFSSLLAQKESFYKLSEAVILQIKRLTTTQGTKSMEVNILLILLLNLYQRHQLKALEMQLLYWLKSFKYYFHLPQLLKQYWVNKSGRDLRLDELLYLYFQNHLQQSDQIHNLVQLPWLQQQRNKLASLKEDYKQLISYPLGEDDERLQMKIINFQISYSSFFDTRLQDSQVLEKLNEVMGRLECPDEEL